jgi:hypothetical protein
MKTVEYQVFASGGNTTYFGDLTQIRHGSSAASTQTRGVWMGGYDGSASCNVIDFMNMASTGNGADFGDLNLKRSYCSGCSDSAGGLGGF